MYLNANYIKYNIPLLSRLLFCLFFGRGSLFDNCDEFSFSPLDAFLDCHFFFFSLSLFLLFSFTFCRFFLFFYFFSLFYYLWVFLLFDAELSAIHLYPLYDVNIFCSILLSNHCNVTHFTVDVESFINV